MEINTIENLVTKNFLAYVRVSSKDQSRGTSLDEQKAQVLRYANSKGYNITKFYGEIESASKMGRSEFKDLIDQLKREKLAGIIFPKIDRSSRNPKDSADLYQLMLEGYQLDFASEGISTDNSTGRHMMYIMWGLASGYSENLRAEINKGILGRLKQGRLPSPPPLGYYRVKDKSGNGDCISHLDPAKAPLLKRMFQEYATGKYTVEDMVKRTKEVN
jgi:site-specific DNA recombinase